MGEVSNLKNEINMISFFKSFNFKVFKPNSLVFGLIFLIMACNSGIKENEPSLADYDILEKSLLQQKEISYDSVNNVLNLIESESLKNKLLFKITYHYYLENDSTSFRYWNTKASDFSIKINDSSRIAESYWDLANFFRKYDKIDSSFFYYKKASILYERLGDDRHSAGMLLNMSILQKNINDYTGSEITTSKALSFIKGRDLPREFYIGYNNLGIIFNELEEFEKAEEYHQRAVKSATELDDPFLMANSLNNLGVVFEKKQKYAEAIKRYEKALLVDSLFHKNTQLYAMLIDNLAFSKFKNGGGEEILNSFMKALLVRDSINHQAGVVISNLHIGEYYLNKSDTVTAKNYFVKAKDLAKAINNPKDQLAALLLLSKVDKKSSEPYLSEYIFLSDSLQKNERTIRNKFARIQFETDEFIAENNQLNKQKRWMIFGFSGLSLSFLLGIVILTQRSKNRKLKLIQQQQASNEEIYDLLIESQEKVEKGQEKEKKRISREIHDGILSQFFGLRLNLEHLNDKADAKSIEKRKGYLQELRKLENEIRKVSHELSDELLTSESIFNKIVEDLLEQQEQVGGFKADLIYEENIQWEKLTPRLKINLYRIIQEALHNVNKYAEAQEVKIIIKREGNSLLVEISDDGAGFEVENSSEGIGIRNMKSRVADLNGQIFFTSGKKGTLIKLVLPI